MSPAPNSDSSPFLFLAWMYALVHELVHYTVFTQDPPITISNSDIAYSTMLDEVIPSGEDPIKWRHMRNGATDALAWMIVKDPSFSPFPQRIPQFFLAFAGYNDPNREFFTSMIINAGLIQTLLRGSNPVNLLMRLDTMNTIDHNMQQTYQSGVQRLYGLTQPYNSNGRCDPTYADINSPCRDPVQRARLEGVLQIVEVLVMSD